MLAGCSQEIEGIPAPTSMPAVPLPASQGPTERPGSGSEEEAILAAYRGYWDTWLAANSPPDPEHPGLERYYTGAALARARTRIAENQSAGVRFRTPPESVANHDASIRHVQDEVAVVDDCSIDDGLIISPAGEILDSRVVTRRSEATLVFDGGWRVEDVIVLTSVDGVGSCDAS